MLLCTTLCFSFYSGYSNTLIQIFKSYQHLQLGGDLHDADTTRSYWQFLYPIDNQCIKTCNKNQWGLFSVVWPSDVKNNSCKQLICVYSLSVVRFCKLMLKKVFWYCIEFPVSISVCSKLDWFVGFLTLGFSFLLCVARETCCHIKLNYVRILDVLIYNISTQIFENRATIRTRNWRPGKGEQY